MLCVNLYGILIPLLSSTFAPYYASIAKHIVESNDWINLVFMKQHWLDKPHLPFWLTAISFKVFGINTFAYVIPAFMFYVCGLIFTYKLAKYWYNTDIALIAVICTASSLHIMLSNIDVRAEAYLIGQIMPACYFYIKYLESNSYKYATFTAIFTAMALMTKGLFLLIIIFSGQFLLAMWSLNMRQFFNYKLINVLCLTTLFISPELIALYLQFDSQAIYDTNHIRLHGIKWFLWDSQFGRFFNNARIYSTNPPKFYYLFYIYTMLWAYLPWWPALINVIKYLKLNRSTIYCGGTFTVGFIIFSITKFQVDHYTNVLFPFISILVAHSLYMFSSTRLMLTLQASISLIIMLMIYYISYIFFEHYVILSTAITLMALLLAFFMKSRTYISILLPVYTISVLFIYMMMINSKYIKYDVGYRFAHQIDQSSTVTIYNAELVSLLLYLQQYTYVSHNITYDDLKYCKTDYMIARRELSNIPNNVQIVETAFSCNIMQFVSNSMLHRDNFGCVQYVLFKCN